MKNRFKGEVEDLSVKGAGVVKHPDGRVFFVRGAWPGDQCEFEILSEEKRYGFARIVKIEKPSVERVYPPCPHQGEAPGNCGGCPWMIASYPSQLKWKQAIVRKVLERAELISKKKTLKDVLPSPRKFRYRNRAQLKTNGRTVGFVSAGSKELAPILTCFILSEVCLEKFHEILQCLPKKEWQPNGAYRWNFIEINEEVYEIRLNRRLTFLQGNSLQNRQMVKWLEERIEKIGEVAHAVELFCGSGNFTASLSKKTRSKLLAVEGSQSAVKVLKERNLKKVKAIALNIYHRKNWGEIYREIKNAQLLLLDPPREGFNDIARFVKPMEQLKDILYISCQIDQFSKDAKPLIEAGWELLEAQPVDLFPQTPGIELLAHFHRRELCK